MKKLYSALTRYINVILSIFLIAIFVKKDELYTPKEYHKYLLENSHFKNTKNLSRSERKSKGMPPNSYNERFYELTQNPYLGYPTTQKKFDLQNSILNNKIRGGAFTGKVPGQDNESNWVSVGPNNVGGRTRGALFDLNDVERDRVLAGGVSGGLWVNEDIDSPNNSEWTMVTGVPGNLSISVIVQDPNNPDIMYAGTGESYTNSDAMGNGIYKSIDSGNNWTRVFGVNTEDISIGLSQTQAIVEGAFFINDLQIWDPTPENNSNSDEVILAVVGQGSGYDGELNEFYDYQTHGLYKSADGGANWTKLSLPVNSNNRADDLNDIEVDLNNKIWVSTTRNIFWDAGGNFYHSTDATNFTQVSPTYPSVANNIRRVEFTPSSTETNTFYILLNATEAEIYKTTDAFVNLTKLSEPDDADRGIPSNDFTRNQAFYDLEIEVDPNDGDIVYVGGIDWFRSTDGGSNWTQITKWSNNADLNTLDCSVVHADQHGMYFDPDDSDKAIVINDGGVYYAKSLSSASTSSTAFVSQESGFITTQFYRVAQMPLGVSSDDDLIIGGTQDNGTLIIDNTDFSGPSSSYEFMGGDGGYTYIDQVGGDYLIANYIYNNSLLLYNLKGLDLGGGLTYKYLSDDSDGDTSDDNEGDFINPGGLDSNLDILYVNGSSGANYKIRRFFDLDTSSPYDSYITGLHSSPTAFKVSPFNTTSSTLFVGYDDGVLQKLENANTTGDIISTNLADFIGSVSDIEFGSSEQEIFVTYYNYGVNNVYYTNDGGSTWSARDGDLPDIPVLSILANPFEANEVIIGTDLGVWMTQDFSVASPTWVQSNNGMTDVRVNDFQYRGSTVSDNRVVASTYGRGIYVGSFDSNDETAPTVNLIDSDLDNIVFNSQVVTITATFSEAMAASPTISLTGIINDAFLSATDSSSVWTYSWVVSTTVTSTTATVSGSDLAGNSYSGTESITFTRDTSQIATLSIDHPDLIVSNNDNPLKILATFHDTQTISPSLSYVSNSSVSTLTLDIVSGTLEQKQWEYNLTVNNPEEIKTITYSSLSNSKTISITYDNTPSKIHSLEVNNNNTAVDVIFTEDLFADYIAHTATGTVVAADFSLTISSTTASLTSATPTSLSVTNTMLTDGKKYTLGFSLNGATSPGDAITVGVSTHTYDIAGNAVVALQVTDTTELFVVTTVGLTDDIPYAEITNCDDIKFQATFNQAVIAPVILQITDSSNNLFELGMTPVTASPDTTWEANWSATTSYSLGAITMTVSHSGAQVQSSTDPGLAIQTFNLTDNNVVCGQVNLTIDHPDTIVSSADSPLEITATFTSAQSVSPTLSYTNNGSTVTYTMGLVSGTISRKNWDYSLPISGPSGQQLFEVGSASVTLTYDDLGPQIYSLDVNDNNTAVDVIFTEDLFADY
ncbi:MAG: hypothetical protein ACO2ZG_03230, partial [Flavobacteriaceae bacterium]